MKKDLTIYAGALCAITLFAVYCTTLDFNELPDDPGDNPNPTTYLVTVNSGTGGGSYAAGVTVSITATAMPYDWQFDKWTTSSAGVSFANANSSSTYFIMPANAVTVKATYKRI